MRIALLVGTAGICATLAFTGATGEARALLAGPSSTAALSAAAGLSASASPAAAAAAAPVAGNWGTARDVPGLAALAAGRPVGVASASCGGPGFCAIGGFYTDASGHQQPFIAEEKNGAWGNAQPVAGAVGLFRSVQGQVTAVACGSKGNCAATGTVSYDDSTGPSGDPQSNPAGFFVVDEKNGTWGAAAPGVTGPIALGTGDFQPRTISCAHGTPGNCALGGDFMDSQGKQQAFVMDETNGTWGGWAGIPGVAELNTRGSAGVITISCGGPARCVAGGLLDTSSGVVALIAEESAGTWQLADFATLIDPNLVNSVSCADAGDCAVVGTYSASGRTLGYTLDEKNGTWGTPKPVPALNVMSTSGPAVPGAVSCAAPGDCAASGTFSTADGILPFVADEVNGTWGNAIEIPGDVAFRSDHWMARSIACPAAGTCVATGGYEVVGTGFHVFVAEERGGTWGNVTAGQSPLQANPGLGQVTCGGAGNCLLAGTYTDAAGHSHAFVDDESTAAAAAITLSVAKVNFGQEQAAKVAVAVTPRTGGTPAGTVTVKAGTTTLATVALNATAKATWAMPAARLKPGTYHLNASYVSSNGFDGNTSAQVTLTVAKPVSSVALALATTKVKFAHETSERLTIKVTSPAGGTPAGKVTIKAGATVLATLTLKSGSATWIMPASRLKVGTYQLTATYASSNGYQPSTSAKKALTVTK